LSDGIRLRYAGGAGFEDRERPILILAKGRSERKRAHSNLIAGEKMACLSDLRRVPHVQCEENNRELKGR
jgi:hypothetical protein